MAEMRGMTHNLRMVLAINEDILQTQVVQIEAELLGLSAEAIDERN